MVGPRPSRDELYGSPWRSPAEREQRRCRRHTNASTLIETFTTALRSNASDDVKSYDDEYGGWTAAREVEALQRDEIIALAIDRQQIDVRDPVLRRDLTVVWEPWALKGDAPEIRGKCPATPSAEQSPK